MQCVDDAIKVWRQIINTITKVPFNKILNGESIRGPELVTLRNGQKIPVNQDDTIIVFYCDPIDEISVVDGVNTQTAQSYELHLIVYGNQSKKISQKIKSNIYSEGILNILRENEIALLNVPFIENTSNFIISQTYTLRSDIKIRFDCVFEDQKVIEDKEINETQINEKVI